MRLAVLCLALAALLVFFGTLAQVSKGLFVVQKEYFQSFFIYWGPAGSTWKLPVFPGGYLIGLVLSVNLLASHFERWGLARNKLGSLLTHLGIVMLLLGQVATDQLAVETHMRIVEGVPMNYSESSMETELVVVDASAGDNQSVYAVPEERLRNDASFSLPQWPFTIKVKQHWKNARLARIAPGTAGGAATQGVGLEAQVTPAPAATGLAERNQPAAVLELTTPQGPLGTWLVADVLDRQALQVQGKTWELVLRPTRHYKPFSITLLKFTHEKYKGTEIPKNFASRVKVKHEQTGEDREVLIFMNNPLRYGGETFYQGSYDPNDPRVSILQVVRNPGWLTPYLACLLVSIGMTVQFMSHLVEFVRKRKAA
jgi:hypothetical protein